MNRREQEEDTFKPIGEAAAKVVGHVDNVRKDNDMGQVAVKSEDAPLAPTGDFNAMIERLATTPGVQVDVIERLLAVQERVMDRNARAAYAAALVQMKPKLPVIDRKGRIEIREKDKTTGERTGKLIQSTGFAKWEDIDEGITPILHEHGFVLTFRSRASDDGKLVVTAVLTHTNGHSDQTDTPPLMHDSTGSKNAVQAVGSSLSYGKRIAATLLLNIRTKGEDDDGKAGGTAPYKKITQKQADDLRDLIETKQRNMKAFLDWAKVEKIEDIAAEVYESCVDAVNAGAGPKKAAR